MVTKDKALETIRNHRHKLAELGVAEVFLFGSVVRGENREASDVDILVEFDRPVGLFHFVRVRVFLERLLGTTVDLVTRDALHPAMRSSILSEALRAA